MRGRESSHDGLSLGVGRNGLLRQCPHRAILPHRGSHGVPAEDLPDNRLHCRHVFVRGSSVGLKVTSLEISFGVVMMFPRSIYGVGPSWSKTSEISVEVYETWSRDIPP
jgi:hypothetical protein